MFCHRQRREKRREEGHEWRGEPGQGKSSESVVRRIQAGWTEETRGEMGVTKSSERPKDGGEGALLRDGQE